MKNINFVVETLTDQKNKRFVYNYLIKSLPGDELDIELWDRYFDDKEDGNHYFDFSSDKKHPHILDFKESTHFAREDDMPLFRVSYDLDKKTGNIVFSLITDDPTYGVSLTSKEIERIMKTLLYAKPDALEKNKFILYK